MIDPKTAALLNEQIGHEFEASIQYVAHATWFASETLPELSRYFSKQSDEEREHALKMIQYLNDTGQTVTIPEIPKPVSTFDSVADAVQLAYDQEVRVTRQIEAIYNTAAEANDRLTQNFLQWFLEEQVEEVSGMDALITVVKRAGDNLFRIEEYVAREGHPEDAE